MSVGVDGWRIEWNGNWLKMQNRAVERGKTMVLRKAEHFGLGATALKQGYDKWT